MRYKNTWKRNELTSLTFLTFYMVVTVSATLEEKTQSQHLQIVLSLCHMSRKILWHTLLTFINTLYPNRRIRFQQTGKENFLLYQHNVQCHPCPTEATAQGWRWDSSAGRHRGRTGIAESCPIPGDSFGVPGVTPRTPGEVEVENSPVNKF